MVSSLRQFFMVILFCLVLFVPADKAALAGPDLRKVLDIAPVWSGHPVGFALFTHKNRQYVAFYDADRQMTVAYRNIDSATWQLVRLPETIGWDSHNYITMTMDDKGHIHLCGNMHCSPLVYFRSTKPYDINTLARVSSMVGRDEQRSTYPQFLRGPDKRLIFTYRTGQSGNGEQLFNVYDEQTQTWRRLLDQPLLSGEGKMNAYFKGPVQDQSGLFHLCWVWRDTPDCATNHDLSYARSKDLVHWETSYGKTVQLPITLQSGEIIDPVPINGGMINGNTRIGFDSKNRPVISYHKFDEKGRTQIYNARIENGRWAVHQTSDWTYRWEFHGGGSINLDISLGAVTPVKGGLSQSFYNRKHGSGIWLLEEATLRPLSTSAKPPTFPKEVRIESKTPGMTLQTQGDVGTPPKGLEYLLKWETLGRNRDHPRNGPHPPPSMLRLYEINRPDTGK